MEPQTCVSAAAAVLEMSPKRWRLDLTPGLRQELKGPGFLHKLLSDSLASHGPECSAPAAGG